MNNIWPAQCWNERTKKMWMSQQLQLLLISGSRVYAWAQGKACMEGGLSLCAMCMVGWSLLKKPFSLPGTDLQGNKSSLGMKAKTMLQEFQSLAGGTMKHRATLGERVFQSPLHSLPISLFSRERLHCFTFSCTWPSTFPLGKRAAEQRPSSLLHPIHGQEISYPSSCAVTSLVLRAGEQRWLFTCFPSGTAVRCAKAAHYTSQYTLLHLLWCILISSLSAHKDKLDH